MIVACVHPRALHHISVHAAGSKAALRLKKFMFEATDAHGSTSRFLSTLVTVFCALKFSLPVTV